MDNKVVFNVKPSGRALKKFKAAFPEATFYGNSSLSSKSKSYLFDRDYYLTNEKQLKEYGNKAQQQPFLKR